MMLSIISDRWGDPLVDDNSDDQAAIARLRPFMGDTELTFVARDRTGCYGVVVEREVPWGVSDAAADVGYAWGQEVTEYQALAGAKKLAAEVAAHVPGATADVVTDPDEVYNGRLGVRVFVTETMAPHAASLAVTLADAELQTFL